MSDRLARRGSGPDGPDPAVQAVEHAFRVESGRAVATLIRLVGDIGVAEEAVQDAFEVALRRWPVDGVPPSPAGWIITTARRRSIDRHRRESSRTARSIAAARVDPPHGDDPEEVVHAMPDDELRLLFTCCHPALSHDSQVALSLRLAAGLTTREIAHAFLVREDTMAQRLARAKAKIRGARIPYRLPDAEQLPARLDGVLATVYLVYTAGHTATTGDGLVRTDLCREAIRLARIVHGLLPDQPEAAGLLALLLLSESRREARVGVDGVMVPLDRQDRSRWDADLVDEGHDLVRDCLARNRPGRYQYQAAVQAVHADAATAAGTDWRQVVALYDQLVAVEPTDVVRLNRAMAVAALDGPSVGLALVDALDLDAWPYWHAARADLLARADRPVEAVAAVDRAIALADNDAEIRFLRRRRRSWADPDPA